MSHLAAITGGTRQSVDVDDLLIKSIHECEKHAVLHSSGH